MPGFNLLGRCSARAFTGSVRIVFGSAPPAVLLPQLRHGVLNAVGEAYAPITATPCRRRPRWTRQLIPRWKPGRHQQSPPDYRPRRACQPGRELDARASRRPKRRTGHLSPDRPMWSMCYSAAALRVEALSCVCWTYRPSCSARRSGQRAAVSGLHRSVCGCQFHFYVVMPSVASCRCAAAPTRLGTPRKAGRVRVAIASPPSPVGRPRRRDWSAGGNTASLQPQLAVGPLQSLVLGMASARSVVSMSPLLGRFGVAANGARPARRPVRSSFLNAACRRRRRSPDSAPRCWRCRPPRARRRADPRRR